ncbi:HAE1 family hydrophobic/amphiphilic exporter-1/multidrug efflux pump [Chromobacterium alkanivorans]|uniref:efflux RND transporter permease subunit n=1 Tax=Chromobacterium TaxID=535 RepID=UPI00065402F6|nr:MULTISPECIES: multidrug efflux RND transporter permease subunit [Chromobacterium]KMN83289.1 RND transporter [Chromobacterium sp. LK11]MBN3002107.1 multidrug efflux RND transporter permease subunit [Chromobacterium alkanivorans]MCS3803308.1 HAE1 family hydrophobic/amphiphilic exporter-1/multidrug efflux pump [Chromobacterium alkanivorans]MCS3817582.1 HAE1 family hydrophobic/amphiphilic exporter-1/multidrug efflux pump [Chromobacterium alkanivorans]MCS3872674.1 HAE1 family hydrophobic/amphiph
MFSAFFIRRPIFASVISIVITLAGLAALKALPIEQYPEIVPPMISVSASYPGASAEVIANTVASPLEQAINGVDDMLYVQSTSSSSGKLSLSVTFKIGTDADQATINVNNRVQSVLSQLPEEVRRQGVNVTKKSSAFLQVISLFSPDKTYDTLFISNYALLNVVDELKRVPGVGDVINFAGQDYSMRVWLKPDRLAQLKLTPSDVAAAIREQNAQFAAGKVGAEPVKGKQDFTYTVTTQGRLSEPEEFENIIVRSNPDGSAVRLKDVARVELGALSYDFTGTHNGRPTIPIGIFLAPGANQLATAQAVEQTMQKLAVGFPKGLNYAIPYDTTKFVEVSIKEVYSTLGEAMVLVFLVVFLFLQNWRATLIPCLAVPVSIIGTFAGMYAFGFTINTLTLFGLVLAIGIVVDDAIVVLENVERLMTQEKLSPLQASFKAMDEVSGALVAIVLVLCSVFIPVAFLGGIAGQMYKQFAITIAVSVSISGLVALTLTPALCALLLKEGHQHPARFFVWFNNWFDRLTQGYSRGVVFLIKRSAVGILLFAGLIAICVGLFRIIPSSLAPDEDQGYIIAAAFLPDGASMQRTSATMTKLDAMTSKNPAVQDVMSFAGFDILTGGNKTNAGVSFITLKPWDERKAPNLSSQAVVGDTFAKGMMGITDGIVLAFNPPPISGMSNTGGFEAYVQSRGGASSVELGEVTKKLVAAAAKRPELKGVQTTFSASVPQIYVKLDRAKAKSLGVPVNTVFDTMQSTFGALYVNDFNKFGRTFRVQLQSEADFRTRVEDLRNIYVRSQDGNMIPLTALVTIKQTTGPESLERFNIFPAAKLVGGPAPGFSSGEALNVLEAVAKETLPDGYTLAWTGSAFQEKSTSGSSAVVFGFGMIMVFLILAAQYERWSLPISVLMAVPFAMFGALMANWMRGLANDVYFQVALVTLIGLSAKNAILIVEFAVQQMEEEGLSVVEAAIAAAKLRFRPIVMTSLAFVLGCMPLAISSGAGSASRHSIGTGVVGGMLAATFIATFFIPMFFMLIMKFSKPKQPQPAAEAGDKADA